MGKKQTVCAVTAQLIRAIEQKIVAAEINDAIKLAEWLARFLSANYCGIYQFSELENQLTQRFAQITLNASINRSDVLHVASEVYAFGGHTRLIRNLLQTGEEPTQNIAITRPARAGDVCEILGVEQSCVRIFDGETEQQNAVALAEYFLCFKHIVLHIHPDDITTAIAVRMAKAADSSLTVYFVNHSDHTFSVAVAQCDYVLEVSTYGWGLRGARGAAGRSTFLGIPMQARHGVGVTTDRNRLILTGGSAYKFRPNAAGNLQQILFKLLQQDSSLHVVAVGPRQSDYWWWRLKIFYPRRFTTIKRLPHREYVSLLATCGLYVDSYPITGGTAFTEALMTGANVLGMFGGPNGYGIADALRTKGSAAFIDAAQKLLQEQSSEIEMQNKVRTAAAKFHSIDSVKARFAAIISDKTIFLPPAELEGNAFDFDFRSEWKRRATPICVGFRNLSQLSIFPTLFITGWRSTGEAGFIFSMVAKAAFQAARSFKQWLNK